MTRWLIPLLLLVAAISVACSAGSDPTPAATPTTEASPTPEVAQTAVAEACSFESATPFVFGSVIQVVTDTGAGTAFAIGNGEFLTAAHVVSNASTISLRNTTTEADAAIVGLEIDTDIAILTSDLTGVAPVRFGDLDALAAGQNVAVAGYPTFVEDEPSVVSGLLSKVVEDPDLGFGTFLQTDAAVNPGNSGGPMFNECGDVIGMVVVKVVDASVEGISWAVAENTLQSALPRVRRKGPPEPGADVDPWFVEVAPEDRYIANTGGGGVSLRDDCLENARIEGSWPEGASVILSHEGIGFCEGWSIVVDAAAETASWVRDDFLAASPPAVARPATPQPTAQPTAQATALPTAAPTIAPTPRPTSTPVPATATPAPSVSRQDVINYLVMVHGDALDFSAQMTAIISNHNDGLITEATASSQSYAVQTAAYAYSDQVLLASNSFASVSPNCESARQWLGDALFYRGLSAGYSGLGYEYWPNVSFADADTASAQSFDSLSLANGYLGACEAGN